MERLRRIVNRHRTAVFWLVLIGIGALGGMMLAVATPFGLGLGNDSVAYLAGAKSLLAGEGYRRIWLTNPDPITHFPPLFSLLLAAVGLFGLDLFILARAVILCLYALNGILTGYLAWRVTGYPVAGMLAALAFFSMHDLLRVHLFVMSEPLYLFLSAFYLLALAGFLQTGRLGYLIGAGILAGLAFLTRYVGLALWVSGGVALALAGRLCLRRARLAALGIYLGSSPPLMLLWLARNAIAAGSLTNRQLIWHPVSWEKLRFGLENLSGMFLPGRALEIAAPVLPLFYFLFGATGVFAVSWLLKEGWRYLKTEPAPALPSQPEAGRLLLLLLVVYTLLYLLFMLLSMSLYDAATTFEERILAPLWIALMVSLAALFTWLWQRGELLARLGLLAAFILWLGLNGYNQYRKVDSIRYDAQGFASRVWKESKTIHDIRELLSQREIFTNKPTLVYILTDRPAAMIPTPLDSATLQKRAEYTQELERFRQLMNEDRAALVILGWEWMEDEAGKNWYREVTLGFTPISQSSEGAIYLAHP